MMSGAISTTGVLQSINVSGGGVPKLARDRCMVRSGGLEGDRQRDLRYHGGPARAVCLYSLDLIETLQGEGHPIDSGAAGENLTISGLDWSVMRPGAVVSVGAVRLELTSYASPCRSLERCFTDGQFVRLSQKVNPGWSRVYAKVLVEGEIAVGDGVAVGDGT